MTSTASDRLRNAVDPSTAVKAPCRAATTVNLTALFGLPTVDGVTLADGDRVLVKNQSDPRQNGIYVAHVTGWIRATDFDGSRDAVRGTRVLINEGTANTGLEAVLTTSNPIAFGTSNIVFSLLSIVDVSIAENLGTVAGSIANLNTVAGNIGGVNTTATNIAAVLDAPTQASAAAASAAAALTSEQNAAVSAAQTTSFGAKWNFATSVTMADPGTGGVRFNNSTIGSVTQIAVSALSADSGSPDISDWVVTWDDSNHTPRGTLVFRKPTAAATFAVFSIVASITDNGSWLQIPVTYVASNSSFSAADALVAQFSRAGDNGTGVGDVLASNNLSDLTNFATARSNLGVLAKASNLSDVSSAATSRTNLGLGTVAVKDTGTSSTQVPLNSDGSGLLQLPFPIAFIAGIAADFTGTDIAAQVYGQIVVPFAMTVTGEIGSIVTAPTGQAAIFDALKSTDNGATFTTIYTTKPQFAISTKTMTAGTLKSDGTQIFAAGDQLQFKCTQAGSTVKGQIACFTLKTKNS